MARLPPLAQMWAISGERAISGTTAIVLPLAVGVATGQVWVGATASLGGFTALYGHSVSYRRRGPLLAGVGAALAASAAVGAALGSAPYWLALALGLMAAAATLATEVWQIGPPGAVMAVLVGGAASGAVRHAPPHLPPGGQVALVGLLVGVGSALAWAAAMARWLRHPIAVEQRTVRAAVTAVDGFVTSPSPAGRTGTAKALRVARGALANASGRHQDVIRELAGELHVAQHRFLQAAALDSVTPLTGRPTASPTRSGRSASRARGHGADPRAGRATGPRWSPGTVLPTAARIGIVVAASGCLAAVFQLGNVYWASLTAVAVLQGPDLRTTRQRGWQRAVGTVGGVLLAGFLLSLHAPLAVTVAFVAVLQLLVEILVVQVYALAVGFITPLVLLLAAIAMPTTDPGALVTLRLQETAIGCLVAFALGQVLWPRASGRRLDAVTAAALEELETLLARPDRRNVAALAGRLLMLHAVAIGARGELFSVPDLELLLGRSRQVEEIGWTVLSALERGDDGLLDAARRALRPLTG